MYAQRGLDYEVIPSEIGEQRPFNTGATEARPIRDRSHPLFTIEVAVESLSGLPGTFKARIEAFGTEIEIEYTVLAAADDGLRDVQAIRDRVATDVRTVSADQTAAVDAAIDRLADKRILHRDGDTVELV